LVDKVFDFIDIGARLLRRLEFSSPRIIARDSALRVATTILQRDFRIHAPIAAAQWARNTNHGVGMTEQQERLAKEHEEIAKRVANFKATQEKFKREREEYFVTTLENARSGLNRVPFWS